MVLPHAEIVTESEEMTRKFYANLQKVTEIGK